MTVRETVTETAASSVPSEAPALVALYFLEDGKVWPEQRGLVTGPAIATNTIHQLFEGTETELTSAIPPETRLRSLAIERCCVDRARSRSPTGRRSRRSPTR